MRTCPISLKINLNRPSRTVFSNWGIALKQKIPLSHRQQLVVDQIFFAHVATVPDWHKLLLQSELLSKAFFIGGIRDKTERQRRWRKRKGVATVCLRSGRVRQAELHWYEAHGIGKRGLKIKRFLDEGI